MKPYWEHRGTEFPLLSLRIPPGFPLQEAKSHYIQKERNQYHHGLSEVITRQPAFYLSSLLGLRVPNNISKMYLYFFRDYLALFGTFLIQGRGRCTFVATKRWLRIARNQREKLPMYPHLYFQWVFTSFHWLHPGSPTGDSAERSPASQNQLHPASLLGL